MKTLKTIIFLPFVFFLSSCVGNTTGALTSDPVIKEPKRIPSPDQKVDAVLTKKEGGATVANSNRIFIVFPVK